MIDEWLMLSDQSLADLVTGDGAEEKSPWHAISTRWRELGHNELWRIEMALYVLTISRPFTFAYPSQNSHVFYIGEGFAHARFRDHIVSKMVPLTGSLTQLRFDFQVLPCESKQQAQASERCLLMEFEKKFGRKPLYNIQGGKQPECKPHPQCYKPLDLRSHRGREWCIWPIGNLNQ